MSTMILAKSGLEPYVKAVTQAVGGRRVTLGFPHRKRLEADDLPQLVPSFASTLHTPKSLNQNKNVLGLKSQLFNNKSQAVSGVGVTAQYRLAHTDFSVPDYSPYRRSSTKDPSKGGVATSDSRLAFTYVMISGVGVGGAIFAKNAVQNLMGMMTPARDCLSAGKVEVNIANIPEGKNVTIKWRGKPVFIRHRTQKEYEAERAFDISTLRDPETDEVRAPNPEWLVVVGICTHLGCVPIAGKGDFGGYYCPCHGSHYDASGRIRKGPAPLNLNVPNYEIDGDKLIVG